MMQGNIFGVYLKKIRKAHGKTQEDLANAIGKQKMYISGMESGKNNPPKTADLEKMMDELELPYKDRLKFLDKAAAHKHTIPDDMVSFILKSYQMRHIIRTAKNRGLNDDKYKKIIEFLQEE